MGFDFLVLSYNIQLAKTGEYPVFDTEWPPLKILAMPLIYHGKRDKLFRSMG